MPALVQKPQAVSDQRDVWLRTESGGSRRQSSQPPRAAGEMDLRGLTSGAVFKAAVPTGSQPLGVAVIAQEERGSYE